MARTPAAPTDGDRSLRWLIWRVLPIALVAVPALLIAVPWRLARRGKRTVGVASKLRGAVPADAPRGSLLVHGVSMGEVLLLRELLPRLEATFEREGVLATTTETGASALGREFPYRPRCFLPFDLPWAVEGFLARLRPCAVVLLELEIWPLFLLACRRRGIPVYVLNARMSERSHRGFRRFRGPLRPVFAAISLVLAQNPLWGARFRACGCRRVHATGSLKADLVRPADAATTDAEGSRLGIGDDERVLVLASTSDPEEERLLPLLRPLLDGWRLVICPRHPERGERIAAACRRHGWEAVRTSSDPLPAGKDAAIVVDEIGRLPALYALAAISVVGGGLGSGRGSQNMWEAAAAGSCTVVGTDTRNFPDAVDALRRAGGLAEIDPQNREEASKTLRELVDDPDFRRRRGEGARAAWARSRGATEIGLRLLHRHAKGPDPR